MMAPGKGSTVRAANRGAAWVVLASVLLFLSSLLWGVVVPGFRGPDELQHFSSVVRLAEGGGWPRPGDARVEDELSDALELSGATEHGIRTVFAGANNAGKPGVPFFADIEPTGVADRASLHQLDDGVTPDAPGDQMTQHPPGYYGVAALVYEVAHAGDWRFDRAMFLMRALTALMIAVTVPASCFVAARQVTGSELIGKIAAFVPLLIPQLPYIGGLITNDGATVAATAVVWASLLTITCSGPTRRRLAFLAVAMAAAFWTKGTAVALLPAVPLAIAFAYRRAATGTLRSWLRPAAIATAATLGLAFVLGGWWWALNLLRYGRIQPSGYEVQPVDERVLGLSEFGLTFIQRMRWTFFGEIGVREPVQFQALTLALTLLFVLLCAMGLFSRSQVAPRLVMLLGAAATVGVLFATTYSAHVHTHRLPGIQGRYLYVLLVPVAVLFAVGLVRLARVVRLPASWLLPGAALAGLAVPALSLVQGFRVFYVFPGRSWGDAIDLFLNWAPWSPVVIAALLAAFLACGLALAWQLGRETRPAPAVGRAAATPRPPSVRSAANDDDTSPVRMPSRERVPVG
jgi:hypothetical protein